MEGGDGGLPKQKWWLFGNQWYLGTSKIYENSALNFYFRMRVSPVSSVIDEAYFVLFLGYYHRLTIVVGRLIVICHKTAMGNLIPLLYLGASSWLVVSQFFATLT